MAEPTTMSFADKTERDIPTYEELKALFARKHAFYKEMNKFRLLYVQKHIEANIKLEPTGIPPHVWRKRAVLGSEKEKIERAFDETIAKFKDVEKMLVSAREELVKSDRLWEECKDLLNRLSLNYKELVGMEKPDQKETEESESERLDAAEEGGTGGSESK